MVVLSGNYSFGPESEINYTAHILKKSSLKGKLSSRVDLVPGAFISLDPEGKFEGSFSSSEESLLSLSYRITKPLRWIGLHLTMGDVDFTDLTVLGVVIKSGAPVATTSRICVRSGIEAGFEDCFFPKHVVSFSEVSTHIDLLRIDQAAEKIPLQAPWREVILFFAPSDQTLTINDFKIFAV